VYSTKVSAKKYPLLIEFLVEITLKLNFIFFQVSLLKAETQLVLGQVCLYISMRFHTLLI